MATVIICVVWAMSSSLLTALNIISSPFEIVSYKFCLFFTICGAALCEHSMGETGTRRWSVLVLGTFCSLAVILVAWLCSNETFMVWKMKTISPSTWRQMVLELKELGRSGVTAGADVDLPIHRRQIPKLFDKLGSPSEHGGGNTATGNNPYLQYGTQVRTWGLVIGSNYFSHGTWAISHRVQVWDDGYFFVGPDY
jgi:hypothetical protein